MIMSIEVRSNNSNTWYIAYVRLSGSKLYLGTFEFNPVGLEQAEKTILSAKQIIQHTKKKIKDLSEDSKARTLEELKKHLRDLVRGGDLSSPGVEIEEGIGGDPSAPGGVEPRWKRYVVPE